MPIRRWYYEGEDSILESITMSEKSAVLPAIVERLFGGRVTEEARPTRRPSTDSIGKSAPFFPQDAVIRRVHGEAVMLLGGGRALLMQVAHPKVAAGVAEYSSFREGKRKRLLRTLKPTLAIVFGTEAQAREAAEAINTVHTRVAGPGYRADDPELLFWVLATLIDTALLMHERFLRPLSEEESEAYYQDMLKAGELLGVRRDLAPAHMAAFREYMQAAIPDLQITPEARSIATDLFAGHGPTAVAGRLLSAVTAELLPVGLREAYGFGSGAGLFARGVPGLMRVAERTLRFVPRALRRTPWFLLPER